MPVQHAVLALLESGESYGYELRARFEEAVGPQWGDLSIGHLYQVLDRLERDGLVTSRGVPQHNRPDRVVYRMTSAGQASLDEWLETPFVRQSGYRDDFFLKLFAAARQGATRLTRVIAIQRAAYVEELHGLAELRRDRGDDPLVRLLIEAAIHHVEANLRTLEQAEADLPALVGAQSVQTEEPPVSRERRGA
jgi:DNA-binding PadR family transcriptional regulator